MSAEIAIPSLTGPVLDQAQLLSPDEEQRLSEQIRAVVNQVQIQVWTIPSLNGEAIESLSIRATDQWKLGSKKADNGVLILIAAQDRAMRIEVGQGLEGAIPDAMAGRIIDRVLIPAFRQGQFFEGLQASVQNVAKLAGGEIKDIAPAKQRGTSWIFTLLFLVMIIVLKVFGSVFGTPLNPRRHGHWSPSARSRWGGGFGGGGFGGGGWSGGGGGFSGGGASGRW